MHIYSMGCNNFDKADICFHIILYTQDTHSPDSQKPVEQQEHMGHLCLQLLSLQALFLNSKIFRLVRSRYIILLSPLERNQFCSRILERERNLFRVLLPCSQWLFFQWGRIRLFAQERNQCNFFEREFAQPMILLGVQELHRNFQDKWKVGRHQLSHIWIDKGKQLHLLDKKDPNYLCKGLFLQPTFRIKFICFIK